MDRVVAVAPPKPTPVPVQQDLNTVLRHTPTVAWRVKLAGPIIHNLAVSDGVIFAVANGVVHAVGPDGKVLWTAEVDASGPVNATRLGPVVGTNQGVVAVFDVQRGILEEKYHGAGRVRGAPVLVGGVPAWTTSEGLVVGAGGWFIEAALSAAGGPASDGFRLVFSSLEGDVVAVEPSGVQWKSHLPGPGLGTPVISESIVIASFGARRGRKGGVAAFDLATGEPRWDLTVDFEPAATPLVDEYLWLATRDGEVSAIDLESGEKVWSIHLSTEMTSSPVVTAHTVFVSGADGTVRRLDRDDGGEVWSIELGSPVSGDPVLLDDALIVGLTNGELVCLRGN